MVSTFLEHVNLGIEITLKLLAGFALGYFINRTIIRDRREQAERAEAELED